MPPEPLRIEASKYQLLRERLSADNPTLDEECLLDTLEGITDLHEMIAAIIRSALVDEALQAGLRTRLEDMRHRLTRLEDRGAKKRQLALETMCEVGLKKLQQPDFTASARAGVPSLIIMSEGLVREPTGSPSHPSSIVRRFADLKRGAEIPGAQLGNPQPTLAVRTK